MAAGRDIHVGDLTKVEWEFAPASQMTDGFENRRAADIESVRTGSAEDAVR